MLTLSQAYAQIQAQTMEITDLSPSASPRSAKAHKMKLLALAKTTQQLLKLLDHKIAGNTSDNERPEQNIMIKRFDALVAKALNPHHQPTSARQLVEMITGTAPTLRTLTLSEDLALERCIIGYSNPVDGDTWGLLFNPFMTYRCSWEMACQVSVVRDHLDDVDQRLMERDKILEIYQPTERAAQFVDYVLRAIELLKFAKEWGDKASEPGGVQWKQEYMRKAFDKDHTELLEYFESLTDNQLEHDQVEEQIKAARKVFAHRQGKIVTARNTFRMLYMTVSARWLVFMPDSHQFGCAVFLDTTWGSFFQTSGRSAVLRPLVFHLATNVPELASLVNEYDYDIENPAVNIATCNDNHDETLDILIDVLDVLSGSNTVSQHLMDFYDSNPPTFKIDA